MARGRKGDPADRSRGGPGSSHQREDRPGTRQDVGEPGTPTNPRHSTVSGGGGERDLHHTHDPKTKK